MRRWNTDVFSWFAERLENEVRKNVWMETLKAFVFDCPKSQNHIFSGILARSRFLRQEEKQLRGLIPN